MKKFHIIDSLLLILPLSLLSNLSRAEQAVYLKTNSNKVDAKEVLIKIAAAEVTPPSPPTPAPPTKIIDVNGNLKIVPVETPATPIGQAPTTQPVVTVQPVPGAVIPQGVPPNVVVPTQGGGVPSGNVAVVPGPQPGAVVPTQTLPQSGAQPIGPMQPTGPTQATPVVTTPPTRAPITPPAQPIAEPPSASLITPPTQPPEPPEPPAPTESSPATSTPTQTINDSVTTQP